jgi:branched-subunit amino acid aminotransferase/4-amino-4-deoxychorismate lyase
VEEGIFPPDDLLQADEIFLTNSIRGIVPVRSVEGRALLSQETARQLRREYAAEVRRQTSAARRA